eukprot:scaffold210604_cov17-Tisochrysis_lutea.AAC.1
MQCEFQVQYAFAVEACVRGALVKYANVEAHQMRGHTASKARIVFSESWWVGTAEENPEERQLPLPAELSTNTIHCDYDFAYGASFTGEHCWMALPWGVWCVTEPIGSIEVLSQAVHAGECYSGGSAQQAVNVRPLSLSAGDGDVAMRSLHGRAVARWGTVAGDQHNPLVSTLKECTCMLALSASSGGGRGAKVAGCRQALPAQQSKLTGCQQDPPYVCPQVVARRARLRGVSKIRPHNRAWAAS